MTDKDREILSDMDDRSIEEISEFCGGLDDAAKARILKKCIRKMNKDNKDEADNNNDDIDDKETDEISADIRHNVKNFKMRPFMTAAACIAVFAAAAGIIASLFESENIPVVPQLPDERVTVTSSAVTSADGKTDQEHQKASETDISQATQASTAVTTDVSQTASEVTVPAAVESTPQSSQADISYEEKYMNVFMDMADEASQRYIVLNGFCIENETDNSKIICMDTETNELFIRETGNTQKDEHSEYLEMGKAGLVTDPRFAGEKDIASYFRKSFTDDIARNAENSFVKYDNNRYVLSSPGKGLLFDAWQTKDAEISDIVPEKSFTITAHGLNQSDSAEAYDTIVHRLTFTNTADGWRISKVEDAVCGVVYLGR